MEKTWPELYAALLIEQGWTTDTFAAAVESGNRLPIPLTADKAVRVLEAMASLADA